MYLHMMPICLSKSGEKNVMGDNLFIYETVYNLKLLYTLINLSESRFRVRSVSAVQTLKSQGENPVD
jgi:hypothetical protein